MPCNHKDERCYWVPEYDDFGREVSGHWEYGTVSTTVDINLGSYKCTQCGKVMYYTGQWRDFFEKGIPCEGSDKV